MIPSDETSKFEGAFIVILSSAGSNPLPERTYVCEVENVPNVVEKPDKDVGFTDMVGTLFKVDYEFGLPVAVAV